MRKLTGLLEVSYRSGSSTNDQAIGELVPLLVGPVGYPLAKHCLMDPFFFFLFFCLIKKAGSGISSQPDPLSSQISYLKNNTRNVAALFPPLSILYFFLSLSTFIVPLIYPPFSPISIKDLNSLSNKAKLYTSEQKTSYRLHTDHESVIPGLPAFDTPPLDFRSFPFSFHFLSPSSLTPALSSKCYPLGNGRCQL